MYIFWDITKLSKRDECMEWENKIKLMQKITSLVIS